MFVGYFVALCAIWCAVLCSKMRSAAGRRMFCTPGVDRYILTFNVDISLA